MQHSDDEQMIMRCAVDDAVALVDDLADVVALGFGYGAAQVWKIR